MKFVAIDVGSTFIKGAVLDANELRVTRVPPVRTPANSANVATRYEIAAEQLFTAVQRMLTHLVNEAPDCAGILFSTQMHGFVLANARFEALSPYVSWQDRASLEPTPQGSALERMQACITDAMLVETGVVLKPNLSLCNLAARGAPEGALFCTLGGYLIARLGGGHVCHITNAAPTGMANIRSAAWEEPIIREAGVCHCVFPRIVSDLSCCGEWVHNGHSYPLYPDIGDHQACVLGAGLNPEEDCNANIGTAGLYGVISPHFDRGAYETRPYFDGQFLKTVTGLPGGKHMEGLVQALCAAHGLSENAAWEMVSCCSSSPDIRIAGTYDFIAQSYLEARQRIGGNTRNIVFAGGCAQRNPALRRAIAARLGLQETTRGISGDVMDGMLQLALVIAGTAGSTTQAQTILCNKKAGA